MWTVEHKASPRGARLADGHYSRRKPGSPQFMPPGQTFVLVRDDAVFGWWRPHPDSGLRSMNGLDGWTCSIFRYVGGVRGMASALILEAERMLAADRSCGPDGLLTYVWPARVASANPGYCFKRAGWRTHESKPRSQDGRKVLLHKPWHLAGQS